MCVCVERMPHSRNCKQISEMMSIFYFVCTVFIVLSVLSSENNGYVHGEHHCKHQHPKANEVLNWHNFCLNRFSCTKLCLRLKIICTEHFHSKFDFIHQIKRSLYSLLNKLQVWGSFECFLGESRLKLNRCKYAVKKNTKS